MGKKIMCIDDASSMRILVKNTLIEAGYEVVEAGNGKEGLDKANSVRTDMFIVDVNMPVMNGFEFVEKIKTLNGYSDTPIIMLTTENSSQYKLKGKELGINGWIVKPFEPQSLVKIINAFMG